MEASDFPNLTADQYRKLKSIEGNGMGSGILPGMVNDILGRLTAVEATAGSALQTETDPTIVPYLSAASAGGSATETLTFTGLAAGDQILSIGIKTQGANPVNVLSYANQAANALDVTFSGDPGVGAIVEIAVKKA
jgi:hypothetical protein